MRSNTIPVFPLFILLSTCLNGNFSDNHCQNNNPVKNKKHWSLVWQDEFNDSIIDTSKWTYEVNAWGGGNNELQYYTDLKENSFIKNGCLIVQAKEERFTGSEGTREYTSARMTTDKKCVWRYGRFEIRAKLPFGKGIWPAIWMLPSDAVYGGWAASGEIDIMECLGQESNKVYGTIHFGDKWPNNQHSGSFFILPKGDFSTDFHTFCLEWEETAMHWYIDDSLYLTQHKWHTKSASYPAPFDQPFYLILNVAIGGNWPGNPVNETKFPQKMIIDYIRVYQKD